MCSDLTPRAAKEFQRPMQTVSVVIPTLNGGPRFREVLARLRQQKLPAPLEILLMDSGSTDQTRAWAHEFDCRVMSVAPGTFDHGLTRNAGIAASTGEIVVLLTQDALPAHAQLIAELVAPLADGAVGGVFGRQLPQADADVLVTRNVERWVAGGPEPRVSRITNRARYDLLEPWRQHVFCVFDNVCSAVRRSAWAELPFRQNHFGEDLDWAKRALEAGWSIVYQPTAQVIHSHDRSIIYEYKRTYMCHRKLFSLFRLGNVPSWRNVPRCMLSAAWQDACFVLRHEHRWRQRWRLWARAPGLAAASVLGQYLGARDERRQKGRKLAGV